MKKLLFLMVAIICSFMSASANYNDGILNQQQVVYSPETNVWTTASMVDDRVVFTKSISDGTGNFSIYSQGECETQLNSNYEFIYKFRLIGVDNENLKFYEILYKDSKIEQKLLTEDQVQEIFPDFTIIKLSEFDKGVYRVISNHTNKKVLLYNDTDFNLHKYFVNPNKYAINQNIKGMIELPKRGKVKYMHIGDMSAPVFVIRVR